MKNCILVVGYSRQNFEAAQIEWLQYNVSLYSVATAQEAIEQFTARPYLAVIASYNLPDLVLLMEVLRESRKVPFLVLPQENSGAKMAESVLGEADMFIVDTDNLIESIKNSDEIAKNISNLSTQNKRLLGIVTHQDIFMMLKCRRVFVSNSEIILTRSEFEILQLLMSQAGQVFTHDQLYLYAFSDGATDYDTINAVRCHISRIRQSLRVSPYRKNYIDSVRSIGYRISK